MFSYGSVFELLICQLRNGVFNLLLGELYPRENEVIPEVRKRCGGWPGFEVFVRRRLTSCWILNAMSPEIQEWSHKSRSIFPYTPITTVRCWCNFAWQRVWIDSISWVKVSIIDIDFRRWGLKLTAARRFLLPSVTQIEFWLQQLYMWCTQQLRCMWSASWDVSDHLFWYTTIRLFCYNLLLENNYFFEIHSCN